MTRKIIAILFIVMMSGCVLIEEPIQNSTAIPTIAEINNTQIINTIFPTFTPIISTTATTKPIINPEITKTITPSPISTSTTTSIPTRTPFQLQSGVPAYISNFAHPDFGCNWMGVVGQVFSKDGKPIINLVVNIKGKYGNTDLNLISLTGHPDADIYGPGAFEIALGNQLISSSSLTISLLDINGNVLATPQLFNTYADCLKNLIIINFTEN